jgi:hypothetical protein
VWLRLPLDPVIVTVYAPGGPEHERVDVAMVIAPERERLVEDSVQARLEGETEEESATIPVKPWRPETVIVDVPGDPASTVTGVGLADIVKS